MDRLFSHRSRRGFTLVELLITIGIIGTLAAIVIVAINPNKQYSSARDAERKSSVKQLQNALYQYLIDNGSLPTGIPNGTANAKPICKQGSTDATCVDLNASVLPLVPKYLASIPQDSAEKNALWSGYAVSANLGRAEVTAMYLGTAAGTTIIMNGLTGYWKLDESLKNGAVADASGNGYNGTATNFTGVYGPSISVPSVVKFPDPYGLSFDGTSSVVTLPNTLPALPVFTVSLWWNAASITSWSGPIDYRIGGKRGFQLVNNVSGTTAYVPHLVIYSGTTTGDWHVDELGNYATSTLSIPVPFNGYHHFVWTFDGTTPIFYYDGVAQTITNGVANYGPQGAYIGLSNSYVGGNVDDVRIYNRVLSPSEIAQIAAGNG